MRAGPRLTRPGDPGYQHARKLFIGRRGETLPAAVASCADEADVAAALAYAREQGLPFAIRGGGHSFAEHSTSDGLVIDLGGLAAIEVTDGQVTVGAGVRVGALTDALAGHDLVVPVGWCRSVGVVGAVLGGGYGVLGRYYGLGADHLLSARVLLADGRVVTASPVSHPDLFWALRGAGGGNFGVVLSISLRTRPAVPVVAVSVGWPYERAAEVVVAWQRHAPAAPPEVNLELSLYASDFPAEAPGVALFGVVVGDSPALEAYPPPETIEYTPLAPRDAARHCDYPGDAAEHVLPRLPEGEARPALRLARSEFFTAPMPGGLVGELTAHLARDREYGVYRDLELIPWGGALSASAEGAFAHRDVLFLVKHTVQTGCRASDDLRDAAQSWVDHSWSLAHRAGSGRTYPNYPDAALAGWPAAYHGANLPKLLEVKRRYDPDNVFDFAHGLSRAGEPA
jgi:FAD/FMN-containing dehydrogenase